jgi:hypothetical protein
MNSRQIKRDLFLYSMLLFLSSCQSAPSHQNIEVKSITKIIDASRNGYKICSSFSLKEKDIKKYFSVAKEVSSEEFNAHSIDLPCRYSGTLIIKNEKFNWEVVAGGAGYLYNATEKIDRRFVCEGRCCSHFQSLC